ncbi:MAG TPA: DEAD/DEAH box helicase [Lentisphaeria bacterium]|mgnify:CR=1 FL=1|nr:MAG: ATP-dependent RNA helicase RhlB [Lentisphaerae bacterium ADurb.Bin082]HPY89279.1 DEAD/DEAH box helicase [Lentisphaeria bacterium]HQC51739.1 DEAD/DEAH box helicase [Lentisphaeria bacterium]
MQFGFISRLLNKIRGDKTSTTSPDQPNAASDPETTSPKSSSRRSRRKSASTAQPGTDDTTAQAPEKKRPPRKKRTGQKDRAAARSGSDRAAAQERRRDGDSGRTPVANIKPRDSVPSMDGWTAPAGERRSPDEKLFQDLNLDPRLLRAIVDDLKFRICSPIQAAALPNLLAGRDLAGRAQTGTGKTAAFLITILQRFLTQPQRDRAPWQPMAIVLAPTRELALQIAKDADDLSAYCPFATVAVYGGMDYDRQRSLLAKGVDLVVATPGRLIDYLRQNAVDLSTVEAVVIDEADRMLDMGFIPDVKRIIGRLPKAEDRQTMLFSATLSRDIMELASRWMRSDPVIVEVEPEQVVADGIEEVVYSVTSHEKLPVLLWTLAHEKCERVLIFRNRRRDVEQLRDQLTRCGIACDMLSGDVDQKKRLRLLEDFRSGAIRVIVATDVAGRGIHVDDITHVINYDLPYEAEDYVHRIGRTARAGHTGRAISFACEEGAFVIPAIEKYIDRDLVITQPDADMIRMPEGMKAPASRTPRPGGRSGFSDRQRSDNRPRGGRVQRGGPRR